MFYNVIFHFSSNIFIIKEVRRLQLTLKWKQAGTTGRKRRSRTTATHRDWSWDDVICVSGWWRHRVYRKQTSAPT